jgi:hypothetical protein
VTTPDENREQSPAAPDVDQPDGGAHHGESAGEAAGTTPSAPDVDQPDGGS